MKRVDEDDIQTKEDNGCVHQTPSQSHLILSDEWDSPRLPYTWTPTSSEALSPAAVDVASRGNSKSSSPSALAASLGVNLEGSALSWTSSLETPPCQTPVRDNHAPGEESLLMLATSVSSLSNPKRLPRALFSPNKTADSDVLGVGLCTTFDEEEDDRTILDEGAVSNCLPFSSSPFLGAAVASLSPWESPVPCSPGKTCVIESTLSDFFDTPVNNMRSRRRQAPGKRAKRNSVGIPSPITGPNTPCESPLHSILSDKKPRTPASVKRVRFVGEFCNSSRSKLAKISENICASNSESKLVNSKESKGLVTSTDNDIQSISDHCGVSNVEEEAKGNVKLAGEEDRATLCAVDQAVTTPEDHEHPSRTVCVVTSLAVETLISASKDQVELESLKDSATLSTRPDHLTEEPSHHGKTGLAETCGVSNKTFIVTSNPCYPAKKHMTDDDMLSQISAETLADMCEHIMDEPEEQTQFDPGKIRARVTGVEVLESVKKANIQVEWKDVHLPTSSSVHVGDPKQQICGQETVSFSSPPSKSERCKDEELFTQISPGFMHSILDSAKVVEENSDQGGNKATPSSSKQQNCYSLLKTFPNVDNLSTGNCKVSSGMSEQFPCDSIQSSSESSTPKACRVRRNKSRHFLYPSAQQINSSCPKNVFNFKTGNHDGSPVVFVPKTQASDSVVPLTVCTPTSQTDVTEKNLPGKMSGATHSEALRGKTAKVQLFTTDTAAPTRKGRKQVSSADFKSFSELLKDCDLDSCFEDPKDFPTEACSNMTESPMPLEKVDIPKEDNLQDPESVILRQSEKQASDGKTATSSHVKFTTNSQTNGTSEKVDHVSSTNENQSGKDTKDLPFGLVLDRNGASMGFKTASGKGFRLSSTSLEKAKFLVSECIDEEMASSAGAGSDETIKTEGEGSVLNGKNSFIKDYTSKSFNGFTTAGGKDVKVSEESMIKAQSFCEECETEDAKKEMRKRQSAEQHRHVDQRKVSQPLVTKPEGSKITTDYLSDSNREILCGGFRTAGGKDLQISKESLEKAKTLVEEDLGKSVGIVKSLKDCKILSDTRAKNGALSGFQTAGGKDVQISEESLEMAKSLVENTDEIYLDKNLISKNSKFGIAEENCEKENVLVLNRTNGFTTAGGNDVRITEESVAKAKALLEDNEVSRNNETYKSEIRLDYHQNTHESLVNLLQGDSAGQAGNTIKSFNAADAVPPLGFTTAAGKGVKISKVSLDKARALVEDSGDAGGQTVEQSKKVFESSEAQSFPSLKGLESMNDDRNLGFMHSQTVGSPNLSVVNNHKRQSIATGSPNIKPKVPKGYRPFKPPRPTPKRETVNSSLKTESSCDKVNEYETAGPYNRSFDDSIADEDLCAHLSTFDDGTDVMKSKQIRVISDSRNVQLLDKDFTSMNNFANHDCLDAVFAEDMVEEMHDGFPPLQKNDKGITISSKAQRQSKKTCPVPGDQVTPCKEFETVDSEMDDTLLEAMMVDMTTTVSMVTSPGNSWSPVGDRSLKGSRPLSFSDDEAFQLDLERLPKEMKMTISSSKSYCTQSAGKGEGNLFDGGHGSPTKRDNNTSTERLENVSDQNSSSVTANAESTKPETKGTCSSNSKTVTAGECLFKTGTGKTVTISEKALKQVEGIIESNDLNTAPEESSVHQVCELESVPLIHGAGAIPNSLFQTASGKTVSVSDKALHLARMSWNEGLVNDETMGCNRTKDVAKLHANHDFSSLFHTASQKTVGISEKALREARTNVDALECKLPGGSMFQTASGKGVEISEKSLEAARAHLSNTEKGITEKFDNIASGDQLKSLKGINHSGEIQGTSLFQTASGQNVTISETAFLQAKSHLCGIENNHVEKVHGTNRDACSELQGSDLFQTASGKNISISEKALFEVKAHLSEGVDRMENITVAKSLLPSRFCTNRIASKEVLGSSLFQTASGQKISISEKAWLEARAHLSESEGDINTCTVLSTTSQKMFSNFEKAQSPNQGGSLFQTASGKDVNISEKVLLEAKAHLSDSADDTNKALENQTPDTLESTEAQSFSFFQKASEKCVCVSGKALQETKCHLSECDSIIEGQAAKSMAAHSTANTNKDQFGLVQNSGLFQTASGNSVLVSVKALKEAKYQLDHNETYVQNVKLFNQLKNAQIKKQTGGCIFQTCSGKPVSVSKQALIDARKSIESDKHEQKATPAITAATESLPADLLVDRAVNSNGTRHSKPSVVFKAKRAGVLYRPPSSKVMSASEFQASVPTSINTSISSAGLSENCDIQRQFGNDVNIVTRKAGNSIYRCNPKFSTPEASFRDNPYRKGHEFHPRHCSEQDLRPADNFTGITSGTDRTPLSPTQTVSSFKTPYKAAKTPENCRTDLNSVKTGDTISGFSPFISGAERACVTCESPQLTSTRADFMAASPKHFPSCSGDNLTENNSVKTELLQSCVSAKLNSGDGSHDLAVSRCELPEDAIACLQMARLQQDRIISWKKRTTVRPCAGKLMTLKKNIPSQQRLKLSDVMGSRAVQMAARSRKVQIIPSSVFSVSSNTAEDFSFDLAAHFGSELLKQGSGMILGDGIKLLPTDDGLAGKAEFYRAFITHENVDPKLISEDWLYNHYRWIVWKLAAYEVYCPHLWAGRCLTPDMVMLQLKYRYDREIDNCQRPALRKILEHDDTPGKRMVLCISDVIFCGGRDSSATQGTDTPGKPGKLSQVELELTDGWYCIRAVVDTPLQELIKTGRLERGDKLCVCGTELTGSEEPANPLQAPSTARLKLCANSTRKARWDSKLGYQPDPRPFSLALSGLLAEGGTVPAVDVVVARVYPKMFFEKLSDGRSVFRNVRAEQKADTAYRRKAEMVMEQLYNKLQQELELQEENNDKPRRGKQKKQLKVSEIESLCTGQEIYEVISSSLEPHTIESKYKFVVFQMALSKHQVALLQKHRQELMDQKRQQLQADFQKALKEKQESQPVRSVVPLLKVRVAGCHLLDVDAKLTCLLTIWRPSEDVQNLLMEGKRLRIYNLTVGAARSRLRSSTVQLTGTRSTRYQEMTVEENFLDQVYEPREVQLVQDLLSQTPAYGELDFVGVVLKIETSDLPSDRYIGCQNVYVVDPQGGLAVIRVWGGLQSLDLEDVLVSGKCFVGGNLLYRGKKLKQLVTFDLSTEITFFTQSPSNRLFQSRLSLAQTKAKDEVFIKQARESLDSILGMFQPRSTEICNESLTVASPVTPRTNVMNRTSYLSTPQTLESSSTDPRKSMLQSKSAKLARYGDAPPLSPLNTPIPKTVRKAFHPPRRQSTPQ
ncbi:uncharacterized protein LOC135473609 [Liolophura sinensis]|uniref:uncharacterized protein LOC135473609 n=1 Tax=Liolophura sinensis TaxID=3198878 RepID=UPI0031581043